MRPVLCWLSLLLLSTPAAAASASHPSPTATGVSTLHPGFVLDLVALASEPTCMAFLPSGSFLVGEKGGRVYLVRNGVLLEPPLWNGELEVMNALDRGLLSVGVDPDFATNRNIYFLYTVDPDTNGVESNGIGFGRLVRYRMAAPDSNALEPGSRAVLLGVDWPRGPVVGNGDHTIGSIRFGTDKSLFVSVGDGASFDVADAGGLDAEAFGPGRTDPAEDIGAFRSQDKNSLCGKILRLNRLTGGGLPDNPFYDGNPASDASKVWEYGLRNPFRFSVRPGTGDATHPGTLFIADVGWGTAEEINVAAAPGLNFGWPCYEGPNPQPLYQVATPAHHACSTITGPMVAPIMHCWIDPAASVPAGMSGTCFIGGPFYTGTLYPSEFQGALFFSDYESSWIRVARFTPANQLQTLVEFATGVVGIVDGARDPINGDLHFVSIHGAVWRLRYIGPPNQRPVAVASGAPLAGAAPLDVQFSSAGTYDPDGETLHFAWAFGDGQSSTAANPLHTYAGGGAFPVVLTVQDSSGWIARDTVAIAVTGPSPFPATSVRDRFDRADGAVGAAWTSSAFGPVIADSAVARAPGHSSQAVWNSAVYAPDQEVFATIANAPSGDFSLFLKVQGLAITQGSIEIRFEPGLHRARVRRYTAGAGSTTLATLTWSAPAAGNRVGARAYADGRVQVFVNNTKLGGVTIGEPLRSASGRVGFSFQSSGSVLLDDFGAGTLFDAGENTAPHATIVTPAPIAFAAGGDTIRLNATGTDAEDPDSVLAFEWKVDLHHSSHVHPSIYVSTAKSGYFIMQDHGDGRDVWYEVKLAVTDLGGLRSEATTALYNEVDLQPGPMAVTPVPAGSGAPIGVSFWLHNQGRSLAPTSHWTVAIDGSVVAQGDTLVAGKDSVRITVAVPSGVTPGTRVLGAVADALEGIAEPNEANNAQSQALVVVPGTGPDLVPPTFTLGPTKEPHGVFAWVRWSTSEPSTGRVLFGTSVNPTDSIGASEAVDHEARLEPLALGTRYYYKVEAADLSGNWATSALDSFTTPSGTLDASDDLPREVVISNATPNPTRGPVRFAIALPRPARVEIGVFDIQGREAWGMAQEAESGWKSFEWSGTNAAGVPVNPGLYLVRVRVEGRIWLRRVAVLR